MDYQEKRNMLESLSDPANWKRSLPQIDLDDPERRWKSVLNNDLSVSAPTDGPAVQARIRHIPTAQSFLVERQDGNVALKNDAGIQWVLRRTGDDDASPLVQKAPVESDLFQNNFLDNDKALTCEPDIFGNLALIFSVAGQAVLRRNSHIAYVFLCAANMNGLSNINRGYTYTEAFHIPFEESSTHTEKVKQANLFKLLVAVELGLDPFILAQNRPELVSSNVNVEETRRTHAGSPFTSITTEVNASWDTAEKKWSDITDFEGHYVDCPNGFRLRRTKTGFCLEMPPSAKESILRQVSLFKNAEEKRENYAANASELNEDSIVEKIDQSGFPQCDAQETQWRTIWVNDPAKRLSVRDLRKQMCAKYGFNHDDCSIIRGDDHRVMISIREELSDRPPLLDAHVAARRRAPNADGMHI
jgi:hypothetical protein